MSTEKDSQLTADKVEKLVPSHVKHYINGAFYESDQVATFENLSPLNEEVLNTVSRGTETDIDKAVKAATAAFKGPWRTMTVEKRMEYLRRIADLIDEQVEELAQLESIDTGLPVRQTRNMVSRASQNFRFYAEMVASRMIGEAFQQNQAFLNYTIHKPRGVAGLITPWNAPFMLETWKVAPALATGNTVILKPAEWSPLTANKLAEIIDKAELPDGVFNVVHGIGEEAGAALVAHPDVQLISFTGETTTGSEIMKNGADTLKRFSMELGGKSPIIVFEDADFERALDAVTWGIFSFNGERCTANSRLLIQESIYEKFLTALKDRIKTIKVGNPLDDQTDVGPLIHKKHFNKVVSYINKAKEENVEIVQGSLPVSETEGHFVPPTLLLGVDNDSVYAQEEIFGPVLTVMTFNDEKEAIQMANDVKYGLAGYVWTTDLQRGHRVAQAVDAGMLWINSQNVRDLRIPFGGSKSSGIGREGGHYAFEFYTETQVIHVALGDHHIPKMGQ